GGRVRGLRAVAPPVGGPSPAVRVDPRRGDDAGVASPRREGPVRSTPVRGGRGGAPSAARAPRVRRSRPRSATRGPGSMARRGGGLAPTLRPRARTRGALVALTVRSRLDRVGRPIRPEGTRSEP